MRAGSKEKSYVLNKSHTAYTRSGRSKTRSLRVNLGNRKGIRIDRFLWYHIQLGDRIHSGMLALPRPVWPLYLLHNYIQRLTYCAPRSLFRLRYSADIPLSIHSSIAFFIGSSSLVWSLTVLMNAPDPTWQDISLLKFLYRISSVFTFFLLRYILYFLLYTLGRPDTRMIFVRILAGFCSFYLKYIEGSYYPTNLLLGKTANL